MRILPLQLHKIFAVDIPANPLIKKNKQTNIYRYFPIANKGQGEKMSEKERTILFWTEELIITDAVSGEGITNAKITSDNLYTIPFPQDKYPGYYVICGTEKIYTVKITASNYKEEVRVVELNNDPFSFPIKLEPI